MIIPTEPIGSIPRPLKLLDAINRHGSSHPSLEALYDEAVRDTIEQFEATGSPVVTDGEQRKYHNFATYCVEGPAEYRTGWIQTAKSGSVLKEDLRLVTVWDERNQCEPAAHQPAAIRSQDDCRHLSRTLAD